MSTPSAPASWSSGTPRALTGSAHPSCCLGAIFGRKCCHTPAHSSSNGASSGTLWTGQPQHSQLKPRRNTTCAPSPCRFSNQAPSSGCNTCEQSVATRLQKWWSARLAGAAMVSRQRAVACSGATAASCASSFPQPLRRETGPGCFALYYYYFCFLSSLATLDDMSFSGLSPCRFLSVTVCSIVTDSGGGHVLVSPATLTIMATAAPSGRAL